MKYLEYIFNNGVLKNVIPLDVLPEKVKNVQNDPKIWVWASMDIGVWGKIKLASNTETDFGTGVKVIQDWYARMPPCIGGKGCNGNFEKYLKDDGINKDDKKLYAVYQHCLCDNVEFSYDTGTLEELEKYNITDIRE